MGIQNYNFIKYDSRQMDHLERHLEDSYVSGSHFSRKAFPNSKSLIDYAFNHIQDYDGEKMIQEVESDNIIGYESLVSLKDLPSGVEISKEPRGKDRYLVNIVKGISKKPTKHMVIIAGPLGDGKHGFYTIFPGKMAPQFPKTEEELKEMGYQGLGLKEELIKNNEYKKFWDNHGFIKE